MRAPNGTSTGTLHSQIVVALEESKALVNCSGPAVYLSSRFVLEEEGLMTAVKVSKFWLVSPKDESLVVQVRVEPTELSPFALIVVPC
jgi:hypothetical protein